MRGLAQAASDRIVALPDPEISMGENPRVLAAIRRPKVGLALWRRPLDPRITTAAAACASAGVEAIVEIDRRTGPGAATCGPDLDLVLADATALARRFAGLAGAERVRLRIETVADDGCRLFHHDAVPLRLVTTWHGPGTQWVRPEWAVAARADQSRYQGPIECLQPGDVALFRGRTKGCEGLILHRSPPLGADAEPRLVGVIDVATTGHDVGAPPAHRPGTGRRLPGGNDPVA